MHQTDGRADPDLARMVVDGAADAIEWLTGFGVDWRMEPLAVGYTAGRTWVDGDELLAVAGCLDVQPLAVPAAVDDCDGEAGFAAVPVLPDVKAANALLAGCGARRSSCQHCR